jgi:apolipoprotein D and lipocalin family protein
MKYNKTVSKMELDKFMKRWYVQAGRMTFLEDNCTNSVEEYTWNEKKERIDINFFCYKKGEKKSYPQKGWVHNKETNTHWKVQFFWPLKFDYFVIALADDYSWTAIGVPSERYLWIMTDQWNYPREKVDEIIQKVAALGYSVENVRYMEQKWDGQTEDKKAK